jgi:hypothetical protein
MTTIPCDYIWKHAVDEAQRIDRHDFREANIYGGRERLDSMDFLDCQRIGESKDENDSNEHDEHDEHDDEE